MGLGIVLIVYLIVLSAAAVCASVLLAFVTYLYLKNVPAKRAKFIAAIACLPFACVAYAGIWFVGYALINDTVFTIPCLATAGIPTVATVMRST